METERKKLIIIIADDKKLELQGNATLLKMCGHEVIPVLNGKPALAEIKDKIDKIDAVFLDWMMPDLPADGILQEVGGLLKKKDIPIFILSGLCPELSESDLQNMGIIKVFEKPASLPVIKETLDNYFSNK